MINLSGFQTQDMSGVGRIGGEVMASERRSELSGIETDTLSMAGGEPAIFAQEIPSDESDDGAEILIIVQPMTDPAFVFQFCSAIQAIDGEISAFFSSAQGAVIRMNPKAGVPVIDLLKDMDEVDDIRFGRVSKEDRFWDSLVIRDVQARQSVFVTLRSR